MSIYDKLPKSKINDLFNNWMENPGDSSSHDAFLKMLAMQNEHNVGNIIQMQPLNIVDNFQRPLYVDKDGNFYCDNNMDIMSPDIHAWDGEPVYRITRPQLNRELYDDKTISKLSQKAERIAGGVQ